MAVDGRKLRDTIRFGSDIFDEHPCSPCAKDNRNVEAIKYCVDCDENICGKCESDHKRFAVIRGHHIENKPRTQAGQNRLDLPTTRCDKHGGKLIDVYCPSHDKVGCSTCDKHGGKLIDVYCPSHDKVGCSTCVAVDHSTCQGIQYIPNVAKGIGTSEKLTNLEAELEGLQKQIASLKLGKQNTIKQLQQDNDKILKEITALRTKINEHLDKMQKRLLEEVNILYDQGLKDIVASTKEVDDIESKADKIKINLQEARKVSEAELFVQFKCGSVYVKENAIILKNMGITVDEGIMQFYTSKEMERLMSENTSFGQVTRSLRPRSALHVGDFDVSLTTDNETCWITGLCLLDNGDIVMADYSNKRLKRLSNTYAVTERIDLPDNPFGICKVDDEQLAVTLINNKKIQFVTQTKFVLGKSFAVRERCRGVVCHDGCLYVCCGGREAAHEGKGRIEVYSITGELKRNLYDGINLPAFIRINNTNTMKELIFEDCISESSEISRVVVIDLHDHKLSEIKTTKLQYPRGVCMIGCNQLCVSGGTSNNIVLVSKNEQEEQELLTKDNGIINPEDVLFDEKQPRLAISEFQSNEIKIFKFVM